MQHFNKILCLLLFLCLACLLLYFKREILLFFQLLVVATDGGGLRATTDVRIQVTRNLNSPVFTQNVTVNIEENFSLATSVAQLVAVDADVLVGLFHLFSNNFDF